MQPFGPAVLRLVMGVIFVAHGAQKLFGVWGGPGIEGTTAYFAQLGLTPAMPLAIVTGVVEFAGGLLLILGTLTFAAAFVLTLLMVGSIWNVHAANGFFLPGGYEFNLARIGALVSLMLTGPGAISVDGQRARSAEAEAAGRARLRAGKV